MSDESDQPTRFPPLINPYYRRVDHNRLPAESHDVDVGDHLITITVARHPRSGAAEEVIFHHPKIGQGLDLMLQDLGVALSRIIQGRDPVTGKPKRERFEA